MAIAVEEVVTETGATNSIVFNKPASATVGRFLLAIISWRSVETTMNTLPDGWFVIDSQTRGSTPTGHVFILGRRMTYSEPSSWTFTQDTGSAGGALTALVISGARNPAVSISDTSTSTSAASVVCPSITSQASGLIIRAAIAAQTTATTFSWASGTEIADNALLPSGSASYHAMSVNTLALANGGSTSTATASWSSSGGNLVGVTVVIADERRRASTLSFDWAYQPAAARWVTWGAQHSIDNGRLKTTLLANTLAYYSLTSVETFDLIDNYIQCELVQRTNQDSGSTETIFGAQYDSNNAVQFMVTGTQLVCRERVGGSNSDSGSVTYSSSTHKYLRIRSSGTTIYWDTSSDGVTWTNRRNKTTTIPIGLIKVEFTAGAWNTSNSSPGAAIWDNLNLPSPSVFQFA